jgi:citrate lyase subunit beta/citryl-CoA lyase
MYGDRMEELTKKVLNDLHIQTGSIVVDDLGALPFVLQARIESAVKMATPQLKYTSLPEIKQKFQYKSDRNRFRRSRLYLPGNQSKLMLNAGIHEPDAVILDLEDSVSPSEKSSARLIVRNALRVLDFFGAEKMVRINQGDLGILDLEQIIPENVHLILIPKIESADQLLWFEKSISQISERVGRKEPVYLMPILESAKGILNAYEIASASNNNVALAIGLEDYTADIGTTRSLEGTESFFARSMIVNAARACGLQPIDTVFSDVSDTDGLIASVKEAKALGFDGKGCIHPRQIKPLHDAFAPSETEISKAQKIVIAFDDAESKGLGVVSLGSKMIDPPVVKRALHTIEMAISIGLLSANWKNKLTE